MDGWMIERRSAQKAFSRLAAFLSILPLFHSSEFSVFHSSMIPTFQ
jgi:hypothetical protein